MTKQYPASFTYYCECVITQNGLVFLASPSHSLEAERLKKHGYHGLVLVWYEGICPDPDDTSPKMTKEQIDTVKKLKVGMTKEYYEKIEKDARHLSAYDACKIAIAYQYPIDSIDFKFKL